MSQTLNDVQTNTTSKKIMVTVVVSPVALLSILTYNNDKIKIFTDKTKLQNI